MARDQGTRKPLATAVLLLAISVLASSGIAWLQAFIYGYYFNMFFLVGTLLEAVLAIVAIVMIRSQ